MGGGAVAIVLGVSLFSPRLVRPLAAVAGWPLERLRGLDRPAGARERAAQPEPHRGHRGGADDRPRPGHLRHRLRRRAQELGRRGRRRELRRRPRDPEHRRLLADPAGVAAAAGAGARASRRWRRCARPQAKLARQRLEGADHRPEPRRRRGDRDRMEEGRPARRCAASPTTRRWSPTPSPPTTTSRSGDRFRLLEPDRQAAAASGRRRCSTQAGRPRRRPRHPAGDGARLRPDPGHDRLRRAPHRGADAGEVQALLDQTASKRAFPTAEVLNQEELKESREEQVNAAGRPVLRAAGAGDHRLAVRDRQHAGALDPRAHPRAGDAAGDRHVAAPGADDDPLRGGDHGADRRDPRHGPRG